VEDASAIVVPELPETSEFNCGEVFFKAQAQYAPHVVIQRDHLCLVAATYTVMTPTNVLRRQRLESSDCTEE
jgi:hypothetical protein